MILALLLLLLVAALVGGFAVSPLIFVLALVAVVALVYSRGGARW